MFGKKKVPAFVALDPATTTVMDSGLAHEVTVEGDGPSPKADYTVTVHYTGWLEDGTEFDSSHRRGQQATFPLNRVIKGWQEGLTLMCVGGTSKFSIPPELAYGSRPPPGSVIPPDATLIFQVDLIQARR